MDLPEDIYELMLDELTGAAGEEERRRLRAWLDASPGHRAGWTALCTLWYSGVIGKRRVAGGPGEVWEYIREQHARRTRRRRFTRRVAAAAAIALLIAGTPLLFRSTEEQSIARWLDNRQHEKVKLILSDGRAVELDHPVEQREENVIISNDSARLHYRETPGDPPGDETRLHELIVPRGGEYRITLSDGTVINLNAGSTLRFPPRFTRPAREVWVTGETYFRVTPGSPFIVHANQTVTTVLGTEFNVMAYPGERTTEITLVRGAVEVEAGGQVERLDPGYRLAVDNATLAARKERVDLLAVTTWKDGIFRFDDIPLDDLMTRLGRWYDTRFEFRHEELKRSCFTGGFKRYEHLERILRMIEDVNDVSFKLENDVIIIDKK